VIRFSLCTVLALTSTSVFSQQKTTAGTGAILRGLEKVNGATQDIEMSIGQTEIFGRLSITLMDCRYPKGNRAGNAYASLEIIETGRDGTVFSGWMIASSPALNAMDHSRYDVWVLRCTTP
jgi:hypothetical protein